MDEFRDYQDLIYGRKQKKQYSSVTILIIINVVVFILALLGGFFKPEMFSYLAFSPFDFLQGKNVWTLITAMFMHGGIFHLLVNMLTLASMGGLLERMIGTKRFLITYFAAGLFGSLFMAILYMLSSDPRVILLTIFNLAPNAQSIAAVGASGAIFGVIGMVIMLRPKTPVYVMFIPVAIPLVYAVVGMFVLLGLFPMVANSAHLGGLLVGLFFGWFWYKRNARMRRLALVRGRI